MVSLWSFEGFKVLAWNYLKLKAHPLFETIKGLMKETKITPADVAENLMPKSPFDNAVKCLSNLIQALEEVKEAEALKSEKEEEAAASNEKAEKAAANEKVEYPVKVENGEAEKP
ncbi:hypothetical protein GH714_022104 [Hevea brasiliensis]|uniref:AAA+ ATPase At3g28540-like C-terminal domain-containing protein n=1 Tax=Hevea brasiliensis TaxID=3981 RepID=A0A6A6MEN1_HEVBR|nr:hypothetical protein GH714_022104 [Hevea brasiliensis]